MMPGKISIFVEGATKEQVARYEEVFRALIQTGGLDGMKNGSTNIHFDKDGIFQCIRFEYEPWRRRSQRNVFDGRQ